jgi:hypothetical protein
LRIQRLTTAAAKVHFPVTTLCFVVNDVREERTGHRRVIPFDLVELLLGAGADPNLPSAHGLPLTTVADERVIRYLVGQGGDIDRWFASGGSPANFAIWQVDVETPRCPVKGRGRSAQTQS